MLLCPPELFSKFIIVFNIVLLIMVSQLVGETILICIPYKEEKEFAKDFISSKYFFNTPLLCLHVVLIKQFFI